MKTAIVLALTAVAASAQNSAGLICQPSANPPIVHAEGVAERLGDIVLSCSGGAAGATATGNFSVFLNTNFTNHLTGDFADAVLTVDNGSGPVPSAAQARLVGPNQLAFNGVSFTLSANGQATLRISNLRGDMTRVAANPTESANANLAINGPSTFALSGSAFSIGRPSSSLFSLILTTLRCSQAGSPLPSTISWNGLIAAGSAYASARVTEGYATAFGAREAGADTGVRIISHYSDFPAGARLLVPDVIAGSTAPQPTSTGDFGSAASAGSYAPGSLLLVRVLNTDANGAGGTLAYTGPGAPPFGAVSDVALANGEGIAVYEVLDANPGAIENAQIPVFLGLAPGGSYTAITKQELRLGPVSTVATASATAPIPRFLGGSAGSDCTLNGDCDGSYLPKLGAYYNPDPLEYEAVAGGPQQDRWLRVANEGQGELSWTTSVVYKTGSGWVLVSPASGINKGSVRVDVVPENLTPGAYEATLIIDAGVGGRATFPISLVVTAGPPPSTTPAITQVIHAATYQASAFVAGSIGTLKGNFPGQQRTVTFDGTPATLLYQDAKQINLIVPAVLGGRATTQAVVTGDGIPSAPVSVDLVESAPGIFPRGVLNQDYSVNEPANPVAAGSFVQVYATGLLPASGGGAVLANLGGQTVAVSYAGAAPGFPGVQQVNLQIPAEAAAGNVELQLCAAGVCSLPATVSVRQ